MLFLPGPECIRGSSAISGSRRGYRNYKSSAERNSRQNRKQGNRSWHGAAGFLFFMESSGAGPAKKSLTVHGAQRQVMAPGRQLMAEKDIPGLPLAKFQVV
jgi:hypothetical protein